MTIAVFFSVTGYVVKLIFITTFFYYAFCIFCLQEAPQLVMVLYLVGCPKPSYLKGLSHWLSCLYCCCSFPLILIMGYGNTKRHIKGYPVFQA